MISPEQYRALHAGAGLIDRSDRGRLRLTGADRRDYLQGLLTNDVLALQPGAGCYAALLNAQGRMLADMYVAETGDEVWMDLERSSAAPVAAHLDRFIFSEDVQVSDESDRTVQLGLFGPEAAGLVARVLGVTDEAGGLGAFMNLMLFRNFPITLVTGSNAKSHQLLTRMFHHTADLRFWKTVVKSGAVIDERIKVGPISGVLAVGADFLLALARGRRRAEPP